MCRSGGAQRDGPFGRHRIGLGRRARLALRRVGDNDRRFAITTDARIVGTPRFLAPEQILGGKLDPRTDVYAAGLTLFEEFRPDAVVHFAEQRAAPYSMKSSFHKSGLEDIVTWPSAYETESSDQ